MEIRFNKKVILTEYGANHGQDADFGIFISHDSQIFFKKLFNKKF